MQFDATESSIRPALLDFLRKAEDSSCVFLTEMIVDRFSRRADLVVANGHLAAFEIKSASDKLSRLEGQLESYKQNFEATTIVCSARHLDGVRKLAHAGVGIIAVSRDGEFTEVRRARYGKVSKKAWLQYLPVMEMRKLLRANDLRASQLSDRQSVTNACMRLAHDIIRSHALNYVKLRDQRNAALKDAATQKALMRRNGLDLEKVHNKNWLAWYSNPSSLIPIPRKVS